MLSRVKVSCDPHRGGRILDSRPPRPPHRPPSHQRDTEDTCKHPVAARLTEDDSSSEGGSTNDGSLREEAGSSAEEGCDAEESGRWVSTQGSRWEWELPR